VLLEVMVADYVKTTVGSRSFSDILTCSSIRSSGLEQAFK
jgi:hypothetical protein